MWFFFGCRWFVGYLGNGMCFWGLYEWDSNCFVSVCWIEIGLEFLVGLFYCVYVGCLLE